MSRGQYLVDLAKKKTGESINKDFDQPKPSNQGLFESPDKDGVPLRSEEHPTSDTGDLLTGNTVVMDIDVISNNDDPEFLEALQHGQIIIYQDHLPAEVKDHTSTELDCNENTSLLANAVVQDSVLNISSLTDLGLLNNSDLINTLDDEGIQSNNTIETSKSYYNDPDWTPVFDNSYHSDKSGSDSDKCEENFENNNDEETINNGLQGTANSDRKARGRKRKFPEQNKEIAKKRKNSNLTYYNSRGNLQEKKQFIDVQCTCKQKCYDSVSKAIRTSEYDKFWELADYNAQNLYITSCVKEDVKKRTYGRDTSKRTFSRVYKLRNIPVCRQMFTSTLRISSKRVNTALVKMRSNILQDRRGRDQGGRNQLTDDQINHVKDQINKIPKYKSHYRRENNDCDFLPPEMTLQKMYNKYIEEKIETCSLQKEYSIRQFSCANQEERKGIIKSINAVSFSSYRKIFLKHFNLKFKPLKKDTCNTCDSFAARIKSASEEEKIELQEEHNKHLDLANEARQQLKEDGKQAKQNNKLECLTFDLEKTLPLPRIPTNVIFYKRQLWFYNAGVHSLGTGRGFCYVWTESEAGRGAQEIGSCLLKHIENYVGREVEDLVLWSDSCGGQNRNVKIVLILKACLEAHPSLKTVSLKFLMPGHSFLPNDADFSDIESALKHVQRLYLPQDYIEVIKNCRRKKPFCVSKMGATDFIGTAHLEKKIVNRKQTDEESPKKISWLKIREIHLKKEEPMKIFSRTDFTSTYNVIDIEKKPTKGRKSTDAQLIKYTTIIT
ncbi:uncharacterized protein LOC111052803 [Nilaparvata lugens]|uniref:uncharacterized protein LOC111052803 n=1 Tax=Nilaparvata lugens TaxID=108931 RepID=UPI00193DC16E|nr:uncharacterized protein LOC111052803 [Nilaparvata lugens]